jgi:hypothetical protein
MAKPLTDEQRTIRINFIEVLANYVKEANDPNPEYVAEQTKQIKRIAKFLSVAN